MVTDLSSFNNSIGTNVDMVAYFHRIVIEVSPICFVWRSKNDIRISAWVRGNYVCTPHNATFAHKAISSKRYDNSMTRTCSPQVSSNDCTTRYDGLATKDDVLRASDSGATRNLVSCVLEERLQQELRFYLVHYDNFVQSQ